MQCQEQIGNKKRCMRRICHQYCQSTHHASCATHGSTCCYNTDCPKIKPKNCEKTTEDWFVTGALNITTLYGTGMQFPEMRKHRHPTSRMCQQLQMISSGFKMPCLWDSNLSPSGFHFLPMSSSRPPENGKGSSKSILWKQRTIRLLACFGNQLGWRSLTC